MRRLMALMMLFLGGVAHAADFTDCLQAVDDKTGACANFKKEGALDRACTEAIAICREREDEEAKPPTDDDDETEGET